MRLSEILTSLTVVHGVSTTIYIYIKKKKIRRQGPPSPHHIHSHTRVYMYMYILYIYIYTYTNVHTDRTSDDIYVPWSRGFHHQWLLEWFKETHPPYKSNNRLLNYFLRVPFKISTFLSDDKTYVGVFFLIRYSQKRKKNKKKKKRQRNKQKKKKRNLPFFYHCSHACTSLKRDAHYSIGLFFLLLIFFFFFQNLFHVPFFLFIFFSSSSLLLHDNLASSISSTLIALVPTHACRFAPSTNLLCAIIKIHRRDCSIFISFFVFCFFNVNVDEIIKKKKEPKRKKNKEIRTRNQSLLKCIYIYAHVIPLVIIFFGQLT